MQANVHFSEKPQPVTFAEYSQNTCVTVVINIHEVEDEPTPTYDEEGNETGTEPRSHWEGDVNEFWELTEYLDKEAILANPENYMAYVPVKYKSSLKDKAQQHLDHIRNTEHIVAVPTYKEGYSVMHREKDDINLLAGMMMGGLPYYEFADGQVVSPLSPEDIQKIYTDLAAHEIKLQQSKQACWAAIEAATTHEEADMALKSYIEG